ncbi:ABC transporter ATP-binding protein [Parafrankia sp. FMc2]|uniref:ABC transporter ATP-binding protein n=1 Tax=Parafrankia sp. FMc2 TaxID=3233196 RepID=UPI0034D3FAA9
MLSPIRRQLVGCAALSAAAAAAGVLSYVAIAQIARTALAAPGPAAESRAVWAWAVGGVAGAVLRLVLDGLSAHVGHDADARMLHHLRIRLTRRLGVLPLGWFRAAGSAQVKKAMTDDLEAMHHLFAHTLGSVLGAAGALTVALGYLLVVDWRMALVTVAVPTLSVLGFRRAMRSSSGHIARLIAAQGRISSAAVEYVDGISVVKTFGGSTDRVLDRFDSAQDEHTAAYRAWTAENLATASVNQVLTAETAILGVVAAAGLGFVRAGWLSMSDLLPFLIVGIGLPTSLNPLMRSTQGLRAARMAAGHLDALLSLDPLPEPAEPRVPVGHRVELDRVSFSYDGVTDVLSDISVRCEPGTVTALVGPSGAGKSTLAALLPRFHDVTAGAVRIGGVDIREQSSQTLLASMSLVFQDVILLWDTVTENIRIGRPDATDEQVRAAARAAQLHEVIERLPGGYDTVLDEAGGGLSGGERQRLTIARAILSDAPVVILDEATAALDADSEAAVQDALGELVAGRTVIVIAHRLHTIVDADQVLVLDRGRLVEHGTHRDLLARGGRYARMWWAQDTGAAA